MPFNKGYELKKFEAHWEKLRQPALCQRREPEGNPRVAGHSDISTTSNIYTHLDFSSKVSSANAIVSTFPENTKV